MRFVSRLNSIATRIAAAIIIACFLVVLTTMGLGRAVNPLLRNDEADGSRNHLIVSRYQLGIINPQHSPPLLAGRMAAVIRAVASAAGSERPRIVAAMTQPDLEVALDTAGRFDLPANEDEFLYRLHQLVQMQLETLSPPILVGARRLPRSSGDRKSASKVEIAATLADGQRLFSPFVVFPRIRRGDCSCC